MIRHSSTIFIIATVITVFGLSGMAAAAGSASIGTVLFYVFLGFVTLSLVLGPILIRRR